MLEGKALIEDTDMPMKMQIQAMASASQALDLYDVFDCKSIAAHIKKVRSCSQLDGCVLFGVSRFCFDVLVVRVEVIVCWQEFDKKYGSGWQCVVGSNFGCFFTHTKGSFIYFTLETLNFLIFKGATSP